MIGGLPEDWPAAIWALSHFSPAGTGGDVPSSLEVRNAEAGTTDLRAHVEHCGHAMRTLLARTGPKAT